MQKQQLLFKTLFPSSFFFTRQRLEANSAKKLQLSPKKSVGIAVHFTYRQNNNSREIFTANKITPPFFGGVTS